MSTKNKIQNAEKCYKLPIVSQGDVKKKEVKLLLRNRFMCLCGQIQRNTKTEVASW